MTFALHVEVSVRRDSFGWESVTNAIIQIGSKDNPAAVNGLYVGVLQIFPVSVGECNNILKGIGSNKRYPFSDRFSAAKLKEVFIIIQSSHNPLDSIEKATRLWSGGIRYNAAKTQAHLCKATRHMDQQAQ